MAKRALCVGINDYPIAGMDLNGCVNDAKGWASVLTRQYDFAKSDVRVILDRDATKKAMLAALDDLLAGAKRGDVLVFTNSSHGTYLAEQGGDESVYDEAMCPYDVKQNPLRDDELRERFADLKTGVRLTVISDSCHSGTVTRAAPRATPDDRRVRFLNPRKLRRPEIPDVRRRARPRDAFPQNEMKEILLSGCRDNQYSYDAKMGAKYHGAMTFCALTAIKKANYQLTYQDLHQALLKDLQARGFDQEPQLEGKSSATRRQIFT